MLKAKGTVAALILIALISVVYSLGKLAAPPDRDGYGRDSFGTRAEGFRAFYELLKRLELKVERGIEPPSEFKDGTCYVFNGFDAAILNNEPVYLEKLGTFIREGGAAVIFPPNETLGEAIQIRHDGIEREPVEPLKLIGLKELRVSRKNLHEETDREDDSHEVRKRVYPYPARFTGVLEKLSSAVGRLSLYQDGVFSLEISPDSNCIGTLSVEYDGEQAVLAAVFTVGKGSVLVISDQALIANRTINRSSNAVCAAYLFRGFGSSFSFDEFYHGLTVRGNPLWLLTEYPFGIIAMLIILISGVWVWRTWVFLGNPQEKKKPNRRDISEYVNALGRIFSDRKHGAFVFSEYENGILWYLKRELSLTRAKAGPDEIAAALKRRDPDKGESFSKGYKAIREIKKNGYNSKKVISAIKELEKCL